MVAAAVPVSRPIGARSARESDTLPQLLRVAVGAGNRLDKSDDSRKTRFPL